MQKEAFGGKSSSSSGSSSSSSSPVFDLGVDSSLP